jgi:hypothetical protein
MDRWRHRITVHTPAEILDLVSEREEGWELVEVAFRPGQMICFWKQPR